jgi:dihydroorotate dehydrogenase (NAD+) catalytic subunit
VFQAFRAVKIPLIGIGGIATVEDALEFIIAGARVVQVGTANFYDPAASMKIIDGLAEYCCRHKLPNIGALVGTVEV